MTIYGGNHQLRRLLQAIQCFIRMQTEIVFELRRDIAEHCDISAGTEKLFAAAGNHNHLYAFIHPRRENSGIQLLHHLVRIGIRRRIIEGQKRNAVDDAEFD